MKFLKIVASVSLVCYSLNASALNNPYTHIIVGSGSIDIHQPIILTSSDSFQNWSLPPVSNYPANGLSPSLTSLACTSGKTCFAGGSYSPKGCDTAYDMDESLMIESTDNGKSWQFKKLNTFAKHFNTISCQNDQFCFAGGSGSSIFGYYPIIMMTTNGGKSWKDVPSLPGYNSSANDVTDSVCNTKVCVAVGEYQVIFNRHIKPFLYTTHDKGKHWQQNKIINLPTKAPYALLEKVQCNETMCIGLGRYREDFNSKNQLLIVVSNEDGSKWIMQSVENILKDEAFKAKISHCNAERCLILGSVEANKLSYLYSIDKGVTWELLNAISGIPEHEYAYLKGLSCTNKQCIAVGGYIQKSVFNPLILQSYDNGRSWQINHNINGLAEMIKDSDLSDIQCKEQNCLAIGSKTNHPYMLYSFDSGQTWSYIDNYPKNIRYSLNLNAQTTSYR